MAVYFKEGAIKKTILNRFSPDWEKVILTKYEFDQIDKVIENLENQIEELNKKNINYQSKKNEIENFGNEKNKEYEEEIKMLKAKNENLLRITKERANADRKITPKREHHGYLFLACKQIKSKDNDLNWKTNIETPYSKKLKYIYIKTDVEKTLSILNIKYTEIKFEKNNKENWVIEIISSEEINL